MAKANANQDARAGGSPIPQPQDYDHPLDLSFTKDINNSDKEVKEYAVSARGDNRPAADSVDSFNTSVLSSIDDSINPNLEIVSRDEGANQSGVQPDLLAAKRR